MTFTIRQAFPSDATALAHLVEQYWILESIDNYDLERVENLLRDALTTPSRAACWIAEDNGHLTGYLLAVFVLSLEHGGLMAEVDEFFIVQQDRGRGIGLALLRQAEHAMRQLGIVRLQLQLGVHNQRARDFYIANGYIHRAGYEIWDKSLKD